MILLRFADIVANIARVTYVQRLSFHKVVVGVVI